MDPQLLLFLLLLAGLVLIVAELFLPSGGLIAVASACCLLASIYIAYRTWYGPSQWYFWAYLGSVAVLIPVVIIGTFQVLINTPLGDRVLLARPSQSEVTPHLEEQQRLEQLIGQRGEALHLMTPGGLVRIHGERLHAVSEGMMIPAGSSVEVVSVRGTRIIVRPVEDQADSVPGSGLDDLAENDEPTDPFSAG